MNIRLTTTSSTHQSSISPKATHQVRRIAPSQRCGWKCASNVYRAGEFLCLARREMRPRSPRITVMEELRPEAPGAVPAATGLACEILLEADPRPQVNVMFSTDK